MFKTIYWLAGLLFLLNSQANATPITHDNLVGHYKVQAFLPFQKILINFRVLNQNEFEIERLNRSGDPKETCNGSYLTRSEIFKGRFSCPSNRSKEVDFDIDFRNKTFEDLLEGTQVTVVTSLMRGKIKATVKRVENLRDQKPFMISEFENR